MKILIDTNVILDIALEREPFVKQAAMLLKAAQQYKIQLFMTATTVTDLYYITRKEKGKETALLPEMRKTSKSQTWKSIVPSHF